MEREGLKGVGGRVVVREPCMPVMKVSRMCWPGVVEPGAGIDGMSALDRFGPGVVAGVCGRDRS
jgi:hypothetical protein